MRRKTMNAEQFDQALLALEVPALAPGPHMQVLAERLSPRWGAASRKGMSRRRRVALFAGITLASLLAAAVGTFTYQHYVWTTGWGWGEKESSDEEMFADADPAYRDEMIALWKSGQVTLVEKTEIPAGCTVYRVRFDFQDGTSQIVRSGEHPNPAARAEWRQMRDAGGGQVVSRYRFPDGSLNYVVRYVLSDGEEIKNFSPTPPMSKADRFAAYDYVTEQIKSGAGTIVGSTSTGMLVVEFTFPDGSAFTQYLEQPYPRPELTEARQDEISQMIALGQGELKGQFFYEEGSYYVVDFTLSDGSLFHLTQERPVMTAVEWSAARAEAAALYAAGQYTRETVTTVKGEPVEILVMTLSTGYVAKIRDVAAARELWGIE
jgi:hypothetical protein